MRRQAAVLAIVVVAISFPASAQLTVDSPDQPALTASRFLGGQPAIPEGNSLRFSVAYSPYERTPNFAYGNLSVSFNGLLEATWTHDGAIGSPTGTLNPENLLGFRLQVLPQREQFPALSVFLTTLTKAQSGFLGGADLQARLPEIYRRGLLTTSYDARTTVAGVSLASVLNDKLALNATLGVREMVWQQMWSSYAIDIGLPTQNGSTFPLAERNNLRVDWSAGATVRPIHQLDLVAEIASLPFVEVDPSSLVIEARTGYLGTIGVRYHLPIPLTIDLYDRWFSEKDDRTNLHQFRLGLSTNLQIH